MFTEKDMQLFIQKGISKDLIDSQLQKFNEGFPYAQLIAAATPESGVLCLSQSDIDELVTFYNQNSKDYNIIKFVPASGAASRMFKDLFEFREALGSSINKKEILNNPDFNAVKVFFDGIKKFAFYPSLEELLQKDGYNIDQLLLSNDYAVIIDYLLEENGLNYAKKPKALLLFHKYDDGNRFAMEEHLVEGAEYARSGNDEVRIHFTVSPEHRALFEQELQKVIPKYVKRFGVSFEISFSEQMESTDTIAVDMDNIAFRDENNRIVFRPGGHGALIENLNKLVADIVFIKNIDNVVPDSLREPTYIYKKVIGAHLIKLQEQIFDYLSILDQASFTEEDLINMEQFFINDLMIPLGESYKNLAAIEKVDFLYEKMNRPIRVCGMVKNEGEPGGGPFWVNTSKGESLQIVESSQIDLSNDTQKRIVESATHFNPVDLVCSLKNYKGDVFQLIDFVDESTGFISRKSKNGRDLKAQELPGLWNGAMADWTSVFIEVPIETFNPVKSVNDLLRPQH